MLSIKNSNGRYCKNYDEKKKTCKTGCYDEKVMKNTRCIYYEADEPIMKAQRYCTCYK